MSFILDAIAKSERERQQQEVPDVRILATPATGIQQPKRKLLYVVTGAMLINVIVLLVWIQTGRSPFYQTVEPAKSAIEPAETVIANAERVKSMENKSTVVPADSSVDVIPVVNAPEIIASVVEAKVSTSGAVANQPSSESKQLTPELIGMKQVESEVNTGLGSLAKLESTKYKNNRSTVVNEPSIRSEQQARLEIESQVNDSQEEEQDTRKITPLSELPYDVRRDLPSVSFTGHLFSKNANLSYVMVNGGGSVIAGQQIVDELFLHKVTPTGVIVDFRGFLIETGVLQNWSLK